MRLRVGVQGNCGGADVSQYEVKLSLDELLSVRTTNPAVVAAQNAAELERWVVERYAVGAGQAQVIVAALREAAETQRLTCYHRGVKSCPACGRDAGYAPVRRRTRYKRKGEPDYDRPRSLGAIELADRFVRIENRLSIGCCDECWPAVRPVLAELLVDARAELDVGITGHAPRWARHRRRHCKSCHWRGHEGEMGKYPAIMGGYYPGVCPACGEANRPLGPELIERVEGYEVVANA